MPDFLSWEEAPDPWENLPRDRYERTLVFMGAIASYLGANSSPLNEAAYIMLRKELLSDLASRHLVPDFIRTCRDMDALWQHGRGVSGQWAPRRQHVKDEFEPLLAYLEARGSPAKALISDRLSSFDAAGVHAAWEKALGRADGDPEGAVTSARTLLEEVCKHLLDEGGDPGTLYGPGDDLPRLYRLASEKLNLAPSQHSEEAFRRILGGCASVVEGLGSLRNKVGDAHAKGKRPVKVRPRHAHLAVNLAGAMALYLVETWAAPTEKAGQSGSERKGTEPPR